MSLSRTRIKNDNKFTCAAGFLCHLSHPHQCYVIRLAYQCFECGTMILASLLLQLVLFLIIITEKKTAGKIQNTSSMELETNPLVPAYLCVMSDVYSMIAISYRCINNHNDYLSMSIYAEIKCAPTITVQHLPMQSV